MSRFGPGIRRGAMAADQFTQIANALFRDSRISYRAKGIFGYISTHRDGWQVTVAALVGLGPDGRDAVRAGLNELERYGYLVRERMRRLNGTLGEIVYSITDRPAAHDVPTLEAATSPALPEAGDGGADAGIRREAMAADQFTQIANGLFRDSRISYKAKGIFGYISTHRDGWTVTVATLARHGRERADAVTTGLGELEKHGFLLRQRDRNADGTLGPALYVITDLPSRHYTRPAPESGYPGLAGPRLAHPLTKNTISKKTIQQNTSPLPPCARDDVTATPSVTDQCDITPPVSPADDLHPGIRLLLEIGASRPELLLTGKALIDQGRVATVMIDAGWSSEQLRHVITDRPLPPVVRTSVGAIIAARLRAAQAYPPPAMLESQPSRKALGDEPCVRPVAEQSSTAPATRTVSQALTHRALIECAGCGLPGRVLSEDLCPACLGWPPCRTCPGPTPRRAHPDGDGRCTTCASARTDEPERSNQ